MDKKLEEMAKILLEASCKGSECEKCIYIDSVKEAKECCVCLKAFYNAGYRKIPENAVVIPKEISCYDNIEKTVKTFSLDGNKVDFTQEQIMALTQIFSFKERRENEIRKETAEKFAERLKAKSYRMFSNGGNFEFTIDTKSLDEIAKEITGGKECFRKNLQMLQEE